MNIDNVNYREISVVGLASLIRVENPGMTLRACLNCSKHIKKAYELGVIRGQAVNAKVNKS